MCVRGPFVLFWAGCLRVSVGGLGLEERAVWAGEVVSGGAGGGV